MLTDSFKFAVCCAFLVLLGGCSRQQSDWQKTRESNTTDAYELFLKKYPSGEFVAQAQARLKELYEERDWQKARDADTAEAYQAFLKQYPEGKWTEEARIRVENFTLAAPPSGAGAGAGVDAGSAAMPGTSGAPAVVGGPAAGAAPSGAPSGASPTASSAESAPQAVEPQSPSSPASRSPAHGKPATATARVTESAGASATAAKSAAGAYAVQLGAFKSGTAAADRRWQSLRKEFPHLLAGLSSKVVPMKTAGGTLYRLRAIGVSESQARHICKRLKASSQPCVIVRPNRA
jgi:cell division protein FtsN